MLWSYRAYLNYYHQLILISIPFRITVFTSFTWGNLFALTFNSVFLPVPTHALFTLASFRILSTDWRPFKRARATRHFLSILPSDAYKAGHVLLIIDYLIGMERKLMNGGDIYPLCVYHTVSQAINFIIQL